MDHPITISDIGKRDRMEDSHFFQEHFQIKDRSGVFGGVFDGHFGAHAAKYAAEHLPKAFYRASLQEETSADALCAAYITTGIELANQDSGACAATYWLEHGRLVVANVGDVRVLVIGKNGAKQLTVDHRLTNPEEKERVLKHGGLIDKKSSGELYVRRYDRYLMPTRTLGDAFFKPVGVISVPQVCAYALTSSDDWLLAACDGVFDVMQNADVATVLNAFSNPTEAAVTLFKEALVRGSDDNITIQLLRLRQ